MEFQPNLGSQIYTLAKSGTAISQSNDYVVEVSGLGLDITDTKKLNSRAKRKIITNTILLPLIDIARTKGDLDRVKQYWNTYHCQAKLIRSGEFVHGKFCKNKCCTLCTAIRKAELMNKYLPVLKEWDDMHFVTLTVKACKEDDLHKLVKGVKRGMKIMIERLKKRHQRGKGIKPMGIRSLECNFNPYNKTYNPHYHLIVPSKEMAILLINEWLKQWKPKDGKRRKYYTSRKAQHMRPINNLETDLIETIKYGAKIFTEPDQKKSKKLSTNPMIYAYALDNIYAVLSGTRMFDRFGFNLPPQPKLENSIKTVINPELFKYSTNHTDWINKVTGECLSGYVNSAELEFLLGECIDVGLK